MSNREGSIRFVCNRQRGVHLRRPFWGLWKVALLLVLLAVALSGCDLFSKEPGQLKVGLLPILDVLPLYVAEQEGFFTAEGLAIELVPFSSALERDVALQAGQIDAEVNDLISAALLNKEDDRVRVVRTAMRATPQKAMFAILSSDQAIRSPEGLKGVKIGISTNSIIEYVVDRLLQAEGLARQDIVKEEVAKIPVRLELLSNGKLPAACLPEPLASLAMAQGAHIVVDDRSHPEYAQSVVTVSARTLGSKPTAVKRFLKAYEQAVQAINNEPEKYRSLLIDKGRVPQPVQDSFEMPVFPTAGAPTVDEVRDVLEWMSDKGMIAEDTRSKPAQEVYDKLVAAQFLP
jgi:NitT/TauT family transport system substrate-binding protein